MLKGHKPVNMKYAEGGPVLGRTRDFMKIRTNFVILTNATLMLTKIIRYGKRAMALDAGS